MTVTGLTVAANKNSKNNSDCNNSDYNNSYNNKSNNPNRFSNNSVGKITVEDLAAIFSKSRFKIANLLSSPRT
jgi:hypothetical protein